MLVLLAIAVVVTGCAVERRGAKRDAARTPDVNMRFQAAPPVTSDAPASSF
jgi:hypothetical protein